MENRKKILVVEDELFLREALSDKLSHEGFDVLGATNGEEGLAMALREHPDLILLDIVLPIMDGLTVLQKIREDKWGEGAKVIILTNLSDALSLGSHDYLVKSDWKIEDVVTKVKTRLEEP